MDPGALGAGFWRRPRGGYSEKGKSMVSAFEGPVYIGAAVGSAEKACLKLGGRKIYSLVKH